MKCRAFAGMVAGLLFMSVLPARAEESDALQWDLKEHVLTVTGTGSIVYVPDTLDPDTVYEIVIGEGITDAQARALSNYRHLRKVTLPSTFHKLSVCALSDNPELAEIGGLEYVTDFNYHCLNDTAYSAAHPYVVTDGKLYYADCGKEPSLTVPDGVTEIMPFAFGNLIDEAHMPSGDEGGMAVSVTLPDSVEIIHENAFALCAGLEHINVPRSLREIGDRAFYDCANLGSLTLGEGVERIGDQAFYNCRSMETLTVQNPDAVFGSDVYGTCYDWHGAIADRSSRSDELKDYERIRRILEKSPTGMDEFMAVFSLHFFDTQDYCNISFKDSITDFKEKRGTLFGWENSTAQTFAADNAVGFEPISLTPGDVNLDRIIDILDVIALNKYLLGLGDLGAVSRAAADYNTDGKVENTDALEILRTVLGIAVKE